jgi:hypothetical protein
MGVGNHRSCTGWGHCWSSQAVWEVAPQPLPSQP